MDQDQQEHKHVCRYCNKSFSNGKVLGGHMRCHVAKNPKKLLAKRRAEAALDGDGNGKSYGLRVNPKKSSRASTDQEITPSPPSVAAVEIPCRVCGKAFDSMRALFGHMRHHSSKRKKEPCDAADAAAAVKRGGEGLVIGETLFAESSGFAKRKRSRRSRYKVSTASPTNCSLSLSLSLSAGSSIEFDPDVEEIAVCLLMLSKGVRELDELLGPETGTTVKKLRLDEDSGLRVSGSGGFLGDKKLSQFSENDSVSLESSDPKVVTENHSDYDHDRVVIDQDCIGQLGWSEMLGDPPRKIEYKCRTCDKTFHSHQALGGHQTVHRPSKACHDLPVIDDDDSSIVPEAAERVALAAVAAVVVATSSETTTSKEHKCPVCFKVFSSGQALGGHKRAHMVKDSEVEPAQIALTSHESCGGVSDAELESPWWVRNNHKHEFLVGLVPN